MTELYSTLLIGSMFITDPPIGLPHDLPTELRCLLYAVIPEFAHDVVSRRSLIDQSFEGCCPLDGYREWVLAIKSKARPGPLIVFAHRFELALVMRAESEQLDEIAIMALLSVERGLDLRVQKLRRRGW